MFPLRYCGAVVLRMGALLLTCGMLLGSNCGGPLVVEPIVDECYGWGDTFTNGDVAMTVYFDEAGGVVAVGEKLGAPNPWGTITFGGSVKEIGRAHGTMRVSREYDDGTYRWGEDDDVDLLLPDDRICSLRNTLIFDIDYSWGSETRGPEHYELIR